MSLQTNLIAIGLLFLVHFVFGYWLSRSGKPFNAAILTVHKLAALAVLVMIGTLVRQLWPSVNAGSLETAVVVLTGLFFLLAILSGGWLSANTPQNALISTVHQILPYLTLISTIVTVYLFVFRKP